MPIAIHAWPVAIVSFLVGLAAWWRAGAPLPLLERLPGGLTQSLRRQRAWALAHLSPDEIVALAAAWRAQPEETTEWAHAILRAATAREADLLDRVEGRPVHRRAPGARSSLGLAIARRRVSLADGAAAAQALACAITVGALGSTLPPRAAAVLLAPYRSVFGADPEIRIRSRPDDRDTAPPTTP